MSLGKSDPPPAPDYVGAAQATAAGNQDAARVAVKGNRVNQYTPYGNIIFHQGVDGDIDRWQMETQLSPLGQQAFDAQQRISAGLGELAEGGVGYVRDALSKPFDWSAVPDAPVNAGTTAQNAIMARLQPQMDQRRAAFEQQMANQGIGTGSEAYANAARVLGQQENDLVSQAALQGISLDTAARNQAIQEQSFARNEPLNMLNAVRSGAQTQLPQFTNVPQQATVPGPNLLGAAMAQGQYDTDVFNAQQAQQGQMMGGLMNLGGMAMLGGFNPFSFASPLQGAVGGNAFGLKAGGMGGSLYSPRSFGWLS